MCFISHLANHCRWPKINCSNGPMTSTSRLLPPSLTATPRTPTLGLRMATIPILCFDLKPSLSCPISTKWTNLHATHQLTISFASRSVNSDLCDCAANSMLTALASPTNAIVGVWTDSSRKEQPTRRTASWRWVVVQRLSSSAVCLDSAPVIQLARTSCCSATWTFTGTCIFREGCLTNASADGESVQFAVL